ncbi:MAG: hypothetical protein EOP34_06205 [Rickettsiales bacterium]|nr:MAG: hypothetical protein EOP34_06205 [Rickettsiales bacterium]
MAELSLNEIYNNIKNEMFYPQRIKTIRSLYKLTQVRFASLIGVRYNTFRNWECGHRYPSSAGCAILKVAEDYPEIFINDYNSLISLIKNRFN